MLPADGPVRKDLVKRSWNLSGWPSYTADHEVCAGYT